MRTLLVLLTMVPALASGQEYEVLPAPAPSASAPAGQPDAPSSAAPPTWSIGAGFSSSDYVFFGTNIVSPSYSGVGGGSYPLTAAASIPVVSASLEHRIDQCTWVIIGFAGAAQADGYESTQPPPTFGFVRHVESQRGAVELGLRGVVTPSDAFVTVSWLGTVEAGLAHTKAEVLYAGQATVYEPRWEARHLAGSVGLAVERALGDRLALRLATPLVRVSYADTEQRMWDPSGAAITKGNTFGVAAVVAPRLELRVFF